MNPDSIRAEIARLEALLAAKKELLAAVEKVATLELPQGSAPTAATALPAKPTPLPARQPVVDDLIANPTSMPGWISQIVRGAPRAVDFDFIVEQLEQQGVKYENRNAVSAALSRACRTGGWVAYGGKRTRFYGVLGTPSGADAVSKGAKEIEPRSRARGRTVSQ